MTATQLSEAIKRREVSSVEITESLLDRINKTNGAINAYVSIPADEALAAARAMDEALSAGYYFGPLHGIPVSVKDLYETKGLRTAGGGRILANYVPDEDATSVARLRRSGAVIVGKTNTHEYAYGYTTENPHYGATRNPWDATRIAGGSSGGSGAAVAARSAIVALGTDTGGSIRVPSSFCGISGLKPTYGRVSRKGVLPLSWSLDHAGPMVRSASDAALVMNVIAGYDPADPASADVPVHNFASRLNRDIRGLRMGIPKNHFFDRIDPEVLKAVQAAIKILEDLGAISIEVNFPYMEQAVSAWLAILLAEASSIHEQDIRQRPEDYGEDVRLYLEEGELVAAGRYLKGQRIRRLLVEGFRDAMAGVDVIITPATAVPATKLGESVVTIDGKEEELFRVLARISSPFDMTGLPALALPCGLTKRGLPVGLQIVGHPFAEDVVLQIGHAYEQATDWSKRRPTM
jgi:aspartyl-tRNA(Asn)/glutamyl-tRNA(Gln) amidotransferase subunit A